MALFHDVGTTLINTTTLFNNSVVTSYMNDLKPLAVAGLGIYYLWLLIPFLLGSSRESLQDIMIKILVWITVFAFAFNGGGYLDMVQNGMNEIFTWAGGGIGFFDNLDNWASKLQTASDTIYKMDTDIIKLQGILAQSIIIFSAFILTVIPFTIIVFTSIGVQIIVMLAPFLILSLLFPSIKKIFYNGIGLFLTFIFTVLIISIIQKSLVLKIDKLVDGVSSTIAAGGDISITSIAINILILCLIYTAIMYASVPIAQAISGMAQGMKIGSGETDTHKSL